ncbi:MAG: PilZ domain-containing protein [Desulfocapsa sp.]|nr:PilZ domain-containing protein [Desulfocapsa sp.]
MEDNLKLKETLNSFFPEANYSEKSIASGLESGDIINSTASLANCLQSALHDESLVEVELGGLTRLFFCRILDHPPELQEEEMDSDMDLSEEEYVKGAYLSQSDHVIITPLEPAIGNCTICSTPQVLIRILTSRAAIEFCCFFHEKTRIKNMPVLSCSFPIVARQVKGAREYRAKIPKEMQFDVQVTRTTTNDTFSTRPMDMSINGACFYDPAEKKSDLQLDETIQLKILANNETIVSLDAHIRHITRLRDAKGLQYVFGVQFDLASQELATDIEKLVAGIQRMRLRELSDIADEFGVDLGQW